MSDETTPETIPYARLAAEVAKRKEVEAALEQANSRISLVERTLNEQYEQLKATHEAEKTEWERQAFLAREGLDPDDDNTKQLMDYVRWQYDQHTPEEGTEKPAFHDFFKGLRESNRVVQSYFKDPPKKSETTNTTQVRDPAAGNSSTKEEASPPKGKLSPQDVLNMSSKEWEEQSEQVFAQFRGEG